MVSGWCPCVPLGRRESPRPQSTNHPGNPGGPYTVSAATDHAEMVQMFYYENRGKCCKKLLRYNGYPNKVKTKLFYQIGILLEIVVLNFSLLRSVVKTFFHQRFMSENVSLLMKEQWKYFFGNPFHPVQNYK